MVIDGPSKDYPYKTDTSTKRRGQSNLLSDVTPGTRNGGEKVEQLTLSFTTNYSSYQDLFPRPSGSHFTNYPGVGDGRFNILLHLG